MMTDGGREGWIFLSYPHKNDELFFLLTIKRHNFIVQERFPEVPKYAVMRLSMIWSL